MVNQVFESEETQWKLHALDSAGPKASNMLAGHGIH